MSKKNKIRYLKKVVLYCIGFASAVVGAGLFVCWRQGYDPTGIVAAAITFFGAELGLACLTRIFGERNRDE
ncbi:hypothetical protein D7X33_17630 [Butyricicoccus sp. 1XD8-22]|nr:hypothetical protein D7X33_17630 [Butyricicoccus sp. 1XD8-22]